MSNETEFWPHGHVTPRPDGAKARCGGPVLCEVCALEQAQMATDVESRLKYMQSVGKTDEAARRLAELVTGAGEAEYKQRRRDDYRVQIAAAIAGGAMTRYNVAYYGEGHDVLTWEAIWRMADDMIKVGGY